MNTAKPTRQAAAILESADLCGALCDGDVRHAKPLTEAWHHCGMATWDTRVARYPLLPGICNSLHPASRSRDGSLFIMKWIRDGRTTKFS